MIINFYNLNLIATTIISVGIAYKIYDNCIIIFLYFYINELILPLEEFKQDPDLLELFGITDIDNNLDLTIETNEHLEYLEYQEAVADEFNPLDFIIDIFNYFLYFK